MTDIARFRNSEGGDGFLQKCIGFAAVSAGRQNIFCFALTAKMVSVSWLRRSGDQSSAATRFQGKAETPAFVQAINQFVLVEEQSQSHAHELKQCQIPILHLLVGPRPRMPRAVLRRLKPRRKYRRPVSFRADRLFKSNLASAIKELEEVFLAIQTAIYALFMCIGALPPQLLVPYARQKLRWLRRGQLTDVGLVAGEVILLQPPEVVWQNGMCCSQKCVDAQGNSAPRQKRLFAEVSGGRVYRGRIIIFLDQAGSVDDLLYRRAAAHSSMRLWRLPAYRRILVSVINWLRSPLVAACHL